METFEDSIIDLSLEEKTEENGKFFITGVALTKDYECETGLKTIASKLINRDFTWRHRHPIEEKYKANHIYGIVRDAWVDNTLHAKVEMYDHTEDHRKLIEDIKLRDFVEDPLSFSMQYRTYFNTKGEKTHYDVFEIAGTPFPHCKTCKINEIGVKKMPDKQEEIKVDEKLEDEEGLSAAVKRIEELEKELNNKTKILEEMKVQVKKFEDELSFKDKALEEKEHKEKSLEDRVLELETKITFLNEKKPILDKLLEADKSIDERQAKWLETQDVDYLTHKYEKAVENSKSQIVVKELEETAEEAKDKKIKEEQQIEKVSYEQFISQIGFKKERN